MKVLIADKFEQSGIDGLDGRRLRGHLPAGPEGRRAGGRASRRRRRRRARRPRHDGHRARCSRPARCRSIVRAGAGYNTIDVAAASRRGIYVSNCPGKNAIAVAELAFALMLALDRRMPDNVAELRAGTWNKKEYSKARGLLRPHARPARLRQHRPGGGAARAGVRHAGRRLEPRFAVTAAAAVADDARRSRRSRSRRHRTDVAAGATSSACTSR